MPTLNWIGKDAVFDHQNELPVQLLEPQTRRAGGGFGFVVPEKKGSRMIRAALATRLLGQ